MSVPASNQVELSLEGMTCAACAARIEKVLNRVPGVAATVNFASEKDGHKMPWNMPELYHPLGYVSVMLFMLLIAIFQVVYFKKRRWL